MIKKTLSLLLLSTILLVTVGCTYTQNDNSYGRFAINSFRDIPGISAEEIAFVEAMQESGAHFSYASSRSTELYERNDGTLGGYTVLFCDWMSGFFEIPFTPEIQGLSSMLENLNSGNLDFATLSATPERRLEFLMTDTIAQRSIIMLRVVGSRSLISIREDRLPRYIFTEGSVMTDLARSVLEPDSYTVVIVPNEMDAYEALMSGQGDAFIATNTMEAAFDHLGSIKTEDFLPLVFQPAAMTAANPELKPIVDLVTKALENGAYGYLTELYRQAYADYRTHKFLSMLNEEELKYLTDNPTIPFATQYMSYPVSFYDVNEGKWDGAVFDIINELKQLTGLEFELVNDENTELSELLILLENETAFFMPNLIRSDERVGRFIWAETIYQSDRFALLSKRSYPNIELHDIPYERVGFAANSAFADNFRNWFPDAIHAREYPTTDAAFMALDRDEVDHVFSSQLRLTALTNYYELSDYKPNYLFNTAFDASFGFNKDQTVLRSIIDKALPMVNTERIVQQWASKTYNIETMRLRTQRPWLLGASVFLLAVLALVVVVFFKNSKMTAQLEAAVKKAYDASRAKGDFLAKMSHEIRTPMNAIIGMTQLALQEDEPEAAHEHIVAVKHAGVTLLSIIDDILDFSKIESGILEIVPKEYSLASLLNDVVSIIKMKAIDSQIRFAVNVDSNLPGMLVGDETRIRQALLNVLNNAFKYTDKGYVSFSVRGDNIADGSILVVFEVMDSGRGIREEDIDGLFADFSQFDVEKNKGIEGVGLGLAITHSIIDAMGGRIIVDSTYGEGSTFTIWLPQLYSVPDPVTAVENPGAKNVLVYENRIVYANSVASTVNDLGVKCTVASGDIERVENCEDYDFVFISFVLYSKNKNVLRKHFSKAKIIVLTEFGEVVQEKNQDALATPVYCVQIAEILNGASGFSFNDISYKLAERFVAPSAKVLIVDDINTNLKVAQGLMLPYKMQIDLCNSGVAAVKAIKSMKYDLVFMDHKMPGMDGCEATKYIREMGAVDSYYKNVPIIALTANAVSGIREMLLENGFDEFLSKPIDTIRLNDILERFIPKDKQENDVLYIAGMSEKKDAAFDCPDELRTVLTELLSALGAHEDAVVYKAAENALDLSLGLDADAVIRKASDRILTGEYGEAAALVRKIIGG